MIIGDTPNLAAMLDSVSPDFTTYQVPLFDGSSGFPDRFPEGIHSLCPTQMKFGLLMWFSLMILYTGMPYLWDIWLMVFPGFTTYQKPEPILLISCPLAKTGCVGGFDSIETATSRRAIRPVAKSFDLLLDIPSSRPSTAFCYGKPYLTPISAIILPQ